ncbi:SAM-dependent methyltransferase [Actinomadura sp. NPDC023710]|uniref:SAM-dependent methyltransferase n=1 Tax=Actinomadura sp. NPDC023710 TaxID=3158219 RepID=UPI0033DD40BC
MQQRTENPVAMLSGPTAAGAWSLLTGGQDCVAPHAGRDPSREAAAAAVEILPGLGEAVRATEKFVARALRRALEQVGVRQVVHIGPGFPPPGGRPCTHHLVHAHAPQVRVVYVDSDPAVLACLRERCGRDAEAVSVVEADLRRPAELLAASGVDLGQPVAVVLANVLTFLPLEAAVPVMQDLIAPLALGSHVIVAEPMAGLLDEPVQAALNAMAARGAPAAYARTRPQMLELLAGLVLLEPGVYPVSFCLQDPLAPVPMVPVLGGVGWRGWDGWSP